MATADAPVEASEEQEQKPSYAKRAAVVVHNDDAHTFAYVIDAFMAVFRYPVEECTQLANRIHKLGRTVVWSGTKELAELKCQQLKNFGPDFYAEITLGKSVQFSLRAMVEELP